LAVHTLTPAGNTRLRRWRLRNGLRQVDVARSLGTSTASICKLELQQTELTPVDTIRFARRLGVLVGEIAELTPLLDALDALSDMELEELALAGPCRRLAPRTRVGGVA